MKVLFLSSGNTGFKKVPFIESQEHSLIDKGMEVDHFLIKGNGIRGYLKNVPHLRKQLKENSYDIIHAHYSFCGWVAVLTFTKIPLVVSYMGSDVYGLVNDKGQKLLRGYVEIFIAKLLQPFVDRIIVKSQNLRDYIYLKRKAVTIPNGVDFNQFMPRVKSEVRKQLNLDATKRLVLFLGNPTDSRKNIQLLREAFQNVGNPNWDLIAPYPVDPSTIPFYLNAADVLVMTSYLEGSPNVIKEAMASNCPIVATDVGDVREVIGNTAGCYITDFDSSVLAEKLQDAIDFNRPTEGRKDIEHLEIGNIAENIIQLYRDMQHK